MKNGAISKLSAKRISSSPYYSSEFLSLEQSNINKLTEAEMLPYNCETPTDILITNTHTDFSKIDQEQLDKCKLIIHPNSGYDNISASFVAKMNGPIIIGNSIRAQAVSNFILSALISHYSNIPVETKWNPSRSWPRKLLSELNIYILGQGHIGTILKQALTPLVKSVRIHDPYLDLIDQNFESIDVIIPACSLNKQNQYIINNEFLLKCNPDFLLINAARGQLVNTQELLDVLSMRPEAFAILDVFEKEPADFSVFKTTKNIKTTSHIAGVYQNIDNCTIEFEVNTISDFINLNRNEFETQYKNIILKNRLHETDFLI